MTEDSVSSNAHHPSIVTSLKLIIIRAVLVFFLIKSKLRLPNCPLLLLNSSVFGFLSVDEAGIQCRCESEPSTASEPD